MWLGKCSRMIWLRIVGGGHIGDICMGQRFCLKSFSCNQVKSFRLNSHLRACEGSCLEHIPHYSTNQGHVVSIFVAIYWHMFMSTFLGACQEGDYNEGRIVSGLRGSFVLKNNLVQKIWSVVTKKQKDPLATKFNESRSPPPSHASLFSSP
ncbi:hypothetical protein VNO80_19580 [Phaseolus coccineus]|uniref:Uncharacterized protein n=1 Tax=Phaseolus coccineus TaxID=3886 RepID=A0AAN9QZX0_PHACN